MNGFLQSAALEVAKKGITINAVEPGNIQIRTIGSKIAQNREDTMKQAIPMGYLGQPEDIAYAMAYLHTSRAMTGQAINIDGGTYFH